MKKVFEITLQTSIDKPSRNIFWRLWRAFRELNGVVSIPFPGCCPDPWRTLTMLHCVSSAGSCLALELLSRLCSPDYTESTRPLPPKAGNGFTAEVGVRLHLVTQAEHFDGYEDERRD